jgi:hypothetical protein
MTDRIRLDGGAADVTDEDEIAGYVSGSSYTVDGGRTAA